MQWISCTLEDIKTLGAKVRSTVFFYQYFFLLVTAYMDPYQHKRLEPVNSQVCEQKCRQGLLDVVKIVKP